MAEGILDGIVGGEHEKLEVEAPEALAGAEAFAAAVAAIASRQDPGVAQKTEEFLSAQTQLLHVQKEHLRDEHPLRLALLRGQRLGQALRIGFQLFLVLVATVIGIGGFAMIRDAINSRGVIIDAFQVPPDLIQRGLSGQVLAKQVLDELLGMQEAVSSRSARPADSYNSSWGADLRVEVPTLGVSFGELIRYLHATLGHETHISGEVYVTPAGISVTARTGEQAGRTFAGQPGDLEKLVRQAAESVYEQTQPYRFAYYLWSHGRRDEALPIMKRLVHDPNRVDRGWAHLILAADALYYHDDLEKLAVETRAALKEIPGFMRAILTLSTAEMGLGHDASAADFAKQCATAGPKSMATIAPDWQSEITAECVAIKSFEDGRYSDILRPLLGMSEQDAARAASSSNYFSLLLLGPFSTHDLDAVSTYNVDTALLAQLASPITVSRVTLDRDRYLALAALERGEERAIRLLADVIAREDDPAKPASHDRMLRTTGRWLALAQARFGDVRGGRESIAETPLDCRMCVDFRGRIASLAGEASEAEKWFAQAIDMAPKLPQVYTDRGQARLDRGDVVGALTDATQSATLSPHDGDAWKLWGDVLAKRGQAKEALAKYDEALKYAPKWKQLQEARDAAAKQYS